MTQTDEKWLDEQELRQLEANRLIFDLYGWAESPVVTFSGNRGAGWHDGDVTDEDRAVALSIRERVKGRR